MAVAEPVRILRIITRLNIGGPAIQASLLSTRLDPARFSTCLVVGEPDATEGDLSELVQGRQARVIHLRTLRRAINPWADLRTFWRLLRIVWHERPQILHTHMAKAGALGRLAGLMYNRLGAGRSARAILVHTFHGHVLEGYFPLWLSRIFVIIERWLARRTDCLIAVSPAIRTRLIELGIGRQDQWHVVPLGLELAALGRLPMPNGTDPVRVGVVGRLVPIKNPALFLDALARVRATHPGLLEGVIVGDGPLRQDLERQAARLGLQDVVQFTGWQRDMRAVYEKMDMVGLTSWNEGTPVALIEAMAAGRAVIATDVGGVRDLLSEPPSACASISSGGFRVAARGVLTRPGDVEGFAAALSAVANDSTLRGRLGETARTSAMRQFTSERLLEEMTNVYEHERARCASVEPS